MLSRLVKAIFWVYGLVYRGKTTTSRPVEGNAGTMSLSDKLWWGHKFFVAAVEHAEPGRGIEEYFAGQNLRFDLPDDFTQEHTATFSSAGDLLTSEHIRPDNTPHLFDDVADFLFDVDMAVANLETPVAPSRVVGAPPKSILSAPPLNTSREMLDVFGRFGFFSTANNHSLDQGPAGVRETIDVLDEADFGHVGTARTYAERDEIPVIDIGGIRVAFLAYTFSVNGATAPAGEEYLVNYLRLNLPDVDISMVERHVQIARENLKADAVVACVHWSLEFESYPIQTVIDNAHRLAELGIDVILGNHPHVIQPMQRHRFTDPQTGLDKDGLIVYAHGDLVSYVDAVPNSMLGNIVRFTLSKGRRNGQPTTIITDVDWRPIYRRAQFDAHGRCTDFRIHDLEALVEHAETTSAVERTELRRLANLAARVLPRRAHSAR
ncbi:CapA family protein [Nocardia sp. NPDC058480]|uniref:CapA family protein n=1 Tax=unclassified Nocardia TaxID=2637762 RepID=UPI0036680DCF